MLPLLSAVTLVFVADSPSNQFVEPARSFIDRAAQAHAEIPADRRRQLTALAGYVAKRTAASERVNLTFICTHNSRRSQLSQVWAAIAAQYHGVPAVACHSGGTEATACNIRTVRALRRAGLSVVVAAEGANPRYLLQYSEERPPLQLYSKVYSDRPNPQSDFAAIMCCSDADKKCPSVANAAFRVPLHYEDPKSADGTAAEAGRYDERCFEIARDMLFLMSVVKSTSTAGE